MKTKTEARESGSWSIAGRLLAGVACAALLAGPPAAASEEKRVIDEVLDILRDEGRISQERYDDLKGRAAEEALADIQVASGPKSGDGDPKGWSIDWSKGTKFTRNDGAFKIGFGGRTHLDFVALDESSRFKGNWRRLPGMLPTATVEGTGVAFRRARLYFSGTAYDRLMWKAEYDFAGNSAGAGDSKTNFREVWIGFKDIGHAGTLLVGHFKEPFSLEEITSSNDISLIERSLISNLNPTYNTGIMLSNTVHDQRAAWSIGGFRTTGAGGGGFSKEGMYNITGRVTGLPVYSDDGRHLVHLGAAYSHQFRDNLGLRYRARPEVSQTARFVDTLPLVASDVDLLGIEAATVVGPVSFQAEYTRAAVRRDNNMPDLSFWGAYAMASVFVTGEHRAYDRKKGRFKSPKPLRNFGDDGGIGAVELLVRYSFLDLDQRDIRGGKLGDLTFGLTWYLFPNLRIMTNYVLANMQSVGQAHVFATRAQVVF